MPHWPTFITRAQDELHLSHPPDNQEYIAGFTSRWAGYQLDALKRASSEGEEHDRLFALLALGHVHTPEARDLLLPFLNSPHSLERWCSALGLGRMHEQKALPSLFAMLTEFLLDDNTDSASPFYQGWRFLVPDILGVWGEQALVPPMRSALQTAIEIELAISTPTTLIGPASEDWQRYQHAARDHWQYVRRLETHQRYEDTLVYALGRLHGLGTLVGITGAEPHLDLWRVHLIMGSLHGKYSISSLLRWANVPQLEDEVNQTLEFHFGLDLSQRERCMQQYEVEKAFEITEIYRRESLQHG